MMLHDKLVPGQFLLDFKNDRSGLLPAAPVAHPQQQPMHLQSPSPPMPGLDLYSAYAYQQQLQQQLLNTALPSQNQSTAVHAPTPAEVLDLSRRCDATETSRKTPSPYHDSPSDSPSATAQQPSSVVAAASLLPTNFFYAAQAQQSQTVLPAGLASLYPSLYYPSNVKQEAMSTTPPPSNPATVTAPITSNPILQTFASAAAASAAVALKQDTSAASHSPPQQTQQPTTPTSSTNGLAVQDAKNTRPFKAFPRDPLVIAANFAATDVLLDNPRVERYTEYRKRVLEQIRSSNGGSRTVTNPKMRRTNSASGSIHEGSSSNNSENEDRHHNEDSSDCDSNSGNDSQTSNALTDNANSTKTDSNANSASMSGGLVKDAAYYERRRKNNAAAKKSRDRRRIKEDEIAIRAAYLERQNIELLCQIDALKAQLSALTSKIST